MRKIDSIIPTSYDEAAEMLSAANTDDLRINSTTYLVEQSPIKHGSLQAIALIYHDTKVVIYRSDHSLILNSGGYRTKTTKASINAALGPRGRVHQLKKQWWYYPFTAGDDVNGAIRVPFEEGMTVE